MIYGKMRKKLTPRRLKKVNVEVVDNSFLGANGETMPRILAGRLCALRKLYSTKNNRFFLSRIAFLEVPFGGVFYVTNRNKQSYYGIRRKKTVFHQITIGLFTR